jgi:hypothetical protein
MAGVVDGVAGAAQGAVCAFVDVIDAAAYALAGKKGHGGIPHHGAAGSTHRGGWSLGVRFREERQGVCHTG